MAHCTDECGADPDDDQRRHETVGLVYHYISDLPRSAYFHFLNLYAIDVREQDEKRYDKTAGNKVTVTHTVGNREGRTGVSPGVRGSTSFRVMQQLPRELDILLHWKQSL